MPDPSDHARAAALEPCHKCGQTPRRVRERSMHGIAGKGSRGMGWMRRFSPLATEFCFAPKMI